MEEVLNQPGVEDAPVAGEQVNAADATQPQTGVDGTAGEKPADSVPVAGEREEVAFAKRLAQEREKLRRELEAELRQQWEAEQKAKQQQAEIMQRLAEIGLDPSLLDNYVAAHPLLQQVRSIVEELQRERALQQEVADFAARFQDVKEIPPEVLEAKKKAPHIPLRYLYLEHVHSRLAEEAAKKAAEELKARSKQTTGPLASQAPQSKLDISKMPKKEFEELVARAKRGELKEL